MKKLLLGACVAALVSGAANAGHFTFTDQLDYGTTGGLVTGSFDGTLSGNLITNLSNIYVYVDGVGLHGNGALYGTGWVDGTGWVSGAAVASLDGTQNRFLFIDSDYPNDYSYTNYFYSVTSLNQDYTYNSNTGGQYGYTYAGSHFHAQVADVPEPASWALMLGGFGAIGVAMRARRRAAVSFA